MSNNNENNNTGSKVLDEDSIYVVGIVETEKIIVHKKTPNGYLLRDYSLDLDNYDYTLKIKLYNFDWNKIVVVSYYYICDNDGVSMFNPCDQYLDITEVIKVTLNDENNLNLYLDKDLRRFDVILKNNLKCILMFEKFEKVNL